MERTTNHPALNREHLRDARLFATRDDMIAVLGPKDGVIAEVGVALGGFSSVMIEALRPAVFVGFDTFELHKLATLWGKTTADIFGRETHREFYERRFPAAVIEEGSSHVTLARYPDRHFDLIYIDARHDYASVKQDAEIAACKLKADGVLVFNDYTMFDHLMGVPYGVVQAVNELIVSDGWKIIGFALQRDMFCDIAISR